MIRVQAQVKSLGGIISQKNGIELDRRADERFEMCIPVSIGLLKVRTVSAVPVILLHPNEAIFVSQVMAYAVLVLRLHANAERVAVRRQVSCLL